LEHDGPISPFSARIELIYRLGLIHPITHKELHLIRRIRNEFAHKKAGLNFQNLRISQLTSELLLPKVWDHIIRKKSKEQPDIVEFIHSDSRSRFITSGALLLGRLTILQERVEQVKISRHAKS
jgi:DNA-binding MltR family transcriptional regulator